MKKVPLRPIATVSPLSFEINPDSGKAQPSSLKKCAADPEKQALIEANRQLTLLINSMHEVLFTVDMVHGKVTHMSTACKKIYGYPAKAFTDNVNLWKEVIHPDDQKLVEKNDEKLALGEEVINRYRIIAKDGSIRWIESKIIPLMDNARNLISINGIVRDITKEKKATKALMESELLFRQFFEAAPEAILVLDVESGIISDYNAKALALFKCTGTALLTKTPVDLSAEFQLDGSASAVKVDELVLRALAGEKLNFEWLLKDSLGNHIICEIRLSSLSALGRSMVRASIIDISERKKAEEELQEAHKRLSFHLENTPLGFIEWDSQLRIKSLSSQAEEVFGWTLEEFSENQRTGFSQVYEEDLWWASKIAQQLLLGEVERNGPLHRNYTKDGKVIWCEWFNSVSKDKDGKVDTIMSLVRNVTDRKKIEEEIKSLNENLEERVAERTAELTEANKALEAFSYSVSHDLRAPARSIIGFSKIIEKEFAPAFCPELKELFCHIEHSGKRMNAIIEDMLTLAKYEKEKLRPSIVDMNALVNAVWDDLQFNTPHGAKLQLAKLPQIEGDSSMMEQVIVNLLSNAIKYSSKKNKPVVIVDCERSEASVTFSVKDNGAGFDMKNYDRLFRAFQRLHGMSEFEGTGVGLLLVKRIIERHSGIVWAEAKVNEGATFYFTIPVK